MSLRGIGALALGIIVAAGLTLGIAGCGKKKESPAPLVTGTPEAGISKVKGQYTEALSKAKDWQQNAVLARVYRKFEGSLGPNNPTPLVFAFSSLAEPGSTYEVEFAGNDVSNRTVDRQSYELEFNPIDTGQWMIDPDNALKIAEDDGGKEFREDHLAGYKLLQQLAKVGAHPLQWYFRYDTGDGSKLRYEVYVNAETGSIDFKKQTNL